MANNIAIENKKFCELNPVLFGSENCEPNHSFGPNVRSYYLIHYVVSGCGVLQNARGEFRISAGEMFLIRPGEVTTYYASDKNPWSYIWIGFTGNLAENFDKFSDVYKVKNASAFFSILEAENMDSMREEFLTAQLFLLYRELFKIQEKKKKHSHIVSNYIKCNYMKEISVEDIAKDMHLDRRYLSRIFKNDYNISIKEYIIKERMSQAYEFLSMGYSVGQTALMVGYNDVFNFSKMFKKTYGKAPSKIQK